MEYQVFGRPGTGKTAYVTRQVTSAAKTHGSEGVLVASLTRAAAAELVSRNLPLDKGQVGTLHGLCYRALGCPPIAETFLKEWNAVYGRRYRQTPTTWDVDDSPSEYERKAPGDELAAQYHVLRARRVAFDRWPKQVQAFARAWEDFKQSLGAIDFTDMIDLVYQDFAGVPGNPAVAFIDEAQDLSVLEFALIRKWELHLQSLVLAGDDDQSLYSFRGADVEAFRTPPLPAEQKRMLTRSWRLPQAVLAYAQPWIERVSRREPKVYVPREAAGVVRRLAGATVRWPEGLLRDLEITLAQGKTVMMLATCGYFLRPLIALLKREGIPFHNPYRAKEREWNPFATSTGAQAADRLLAYLRPFGDVWGDASRMWTAADVALWTGALQAEAVLRPGANLGLARIQKDSPLELERLEGLLLSDALEKAADGDLAWFKERLMPNQRKRMIFPIAVARRRGAQFMMKRPQVIVGTIHSVKGGEADVVYVFPDLSGQGMRAWLSGNPAQHDAIIRQFYVAFTRARETLVLCGQASPKAVRLP